MMSTRRQRHRPGSATRCRGEQRHPVELPEAGPLLPKMLQTRGQASVDVTSSDETDPQFMLLKEPIVRNDNTGKEEICLSKKENRNHYRCDESDDNNGECSGHREESIVRSQSLQDYINRLKALRENPKQVYDSQLKANNPQKCTDVFNSNNGTVHKNNQPQPSPSLQDFARRLRGVSMESLNRHSQNKRSRLSMVSNDRNNVASTGEIQTLDSKGEYNNQKVSKTKSCIRNPRPWNAVACFLATASFLTTVNTDFLPLIRTIALRNLLPPDHINYRDDPLLVICLIIMWSVHFMRRFSEILFLHDYRREYNPMEGVWINIHYTVFGFWIGWSCNYYLEYWTPKNYILVPGVIIFLVGEIGNCYCHVTLKRMRNENQDIHFRGSHLVPPGFFFRHVFCPHYIFEVISWIGFAVSVFTLPAFIFLGSNIISLIVYAALRRHAYLK